MTTENVIVLFTDMVGSTALASGLAPDAADGLRREHFSILRQAVTEAGGTEVKNLGDGLMVAFATASAALSCAVGMQQGVERDNRAREQLVGLRVGLSIGEVTREDDDYFGDPVIEAARLCAACEGGQILAADIVRGMAGRRSKHKCVSFGPLALRGLPEPLETVEVRWEPLADAATGIPLPARLGVRPTVGVVGREAEIASILHAYKRVATGEGREVLLISGEAGLGKTTLVAETARAVFDAGACVLFGHCEEDLATPYQLFGEALGHYVTHAPEDQLLAHVAAYGSELARLVPALASRLPDLAPSSATDSETERFLLFGAVVGLLAAASAQRPIVLVLDDLQWADKASLLLLRHVTAAAVAMGVLVIGTYRDSELSRSHPLLDTLSALHRQQGVSRIELAGLDDTGVIAFLEAAAGHALDEAGVGLAHAVHRETDGNPFFVSEVLLHLAETGAIAQDATGRWTAAGTLEQMALPESVRVVIGARVGRLGSDAEHVLSMAAVIGRDFDLDLLASATQRSEDAVLDVLEAGTAASLVRELADTPGHYNFAHALIQHTLYEDMTLTRRARSHRTVAEALEELCGDDPGARIGELAYHWAHATQPQDGNKAIAYAQRAGDRALAQLAPDEALRWYRDALDLLDQAAGDDPHRRAELLLGLGEAQRQAGIPSYRETLLDAGNLAQQIGGTDQLVRAALANNRVRGFASIAGQVDTERIAVLQAGLNALGDADGAARARLLANLALELAYSGDLDRRRPLSAEAVSLARRVGDPATLLHVLLQAQPGIWDPQSVEARSATTAEAVELAEEMGDPIARFWAAMQRLQQAMPLGDLAEVDRCVARLITLAEEVGQPMLRWVATWQRTWRVLLSGDHAESERLANEHFQLASNMGEPDALAFFGAQVMAIRWHQGRIGELSALIAQTVANNPGIPAFRAAQALAYIEVGHDEQARSLLFAAAELGFAEAPSDSSWLSTLSFYAEVAARLEAAGPAGVLYERLLPWRALIAFNGSTVDGSVAYYLGLLATTLGRHDDAESHFTEAALTHHRLRAPFHEARTRVGWARLCAARNGSDDRAHARELLDQALLVARRFGYEGIEGRAGAMLELLH